MPEPERRFRDILNGHIPQKVEASIVRMLNGMRKAGARSLSEL